MTIPNTDILEGKWKQMRGALRERWANVTDDDLERIVGRRDQMVGLLQERYGYTRQEASNQLDDFVRSYNAKMDEVKAAAERAGDDEKSKAGGVIMAIAVLSAVVGLIYLLSRQSE